MGNYTNEQLKDVLSENNGQYAIDLKEMNPLQIQGWSLVVLFHRISRIADQAGMCGVTFQLKSFDHWEKRSGEDVFDLMWKANKAFRGKTIWKVQQDADRDDLKFRVSNHKFADQVMRDLNL